MAAERRYTQQEVDAILKRALERDGASGTGSAALTHQDLLDTAREVGIEAGEVERAIAEVRAQKAEQALVDEATRRKQERFRKSAMSWAFVNTLLVMIWALAGMGYPWFLWVLGPWAVPVFFQYVALSQPPTTRELDKLRRKLDREERKRQLAANFQRGAQALGDVVEQGASLLLAHLDDQQKRLDDSRRQDRQLPPRKP